jgi:hypothetical protein
VPLKVALLDRGTTCYNATNERDRSGRVEKEMIVTKKKEGLKQTDVTLKKEQRAREGAKAMLAYEAEGCAIREKTARLRALRLAKEAADKNKETAT